MNKYIMDSKNHKCRKINAINTETYQIGCNKCIKDNQELLEDYITDFLTP